MCPIVTGLSKYSPVRPSLKRTLPSLESGTPFQRFLCSLLSDRYCNTSGRSSCHDTPFADQKAGSADLTLFLLGLIRLLLPKVLLPATTALGTIDSDGREKGILAGANVIMPNLSPPQVREKYLLYDSKLCTGDEAAESLRSLKQRIQNIGYEITVSRGDSLNI